VFHRKKPKRRQAAALQIPAKADQLILVLWFKEMTIAEQSPQRGDG
jgi:hypothetical protein